MRTRIIVLLCCMSFSIMASAQASGGQIRRNVQRTTNKVKRTVSSSGNTTRSYTTREMFEMGKSFYDKGNYTEALNWYKKAAENGSSDAQSELGFMYMNGEGTPVNKSEGAKWLLKASENGDFLAQRALGFMYKKGDGVPQNISESNKWLKKASYQFYEVGRKNMKTDGQVAIQFFSWVYEMSQKPYDVWSLFHIGEIHYFAEGGVHTDFQEAAKYFKAASDMGNRVAMYFLGICYEFGRGIPKDLSKAQQYYKESGYNSIPSRDF